MSKLSNFITGNITLKSQSIDVVEISKEVLLYLPSDVEKMSFHVICNSSGEQFVYGYLYANKRYGILHVDTIQGTFKTVKVWNGVCSILK